MLRLLALALLAAPALAQVAVNVPSTSGLRSDLAVAPDGTFYLSGNSNAADFDPGPGEASTTSYGGFVVAYGPDGAFRWLWYGDGGSQSVAIESVAVRPGGGVVAVGQLRGTVDADPGPGVTTVTANNGLLVVALTAAGALDWVVALDGSARVFAQGVGVDAAGDVYLTGWIGGPGTVDLDPGPGETTLATNDLDLFVASFDAAGTFRWAFDIGTPAGQPSTQVRGYDLAVDATGVLVTGSFRTTIDFDPGPADAPLVAEGTDGYVARYTTDGAFVWANRFGPSFLLDVGYGIAAVGDGGALVAGSVEDFETQEDLYVARLDASGVTVWSHQLGTEGGTPTDLDEFVGAAVLGDRAVVAGRFGSSFDADPGPGQALIEVPPGGPYNGVYGVVAAYDLATGTFEDAVRIGDVSQTGLTAVAAGPSAEAPVAVAGTFTGSVSIPGGATLTAPAAFATNPFFAAFVLGDPPPLTLLVEEQVGVLDSAALFKALALLVNERIGVTDEVSLLEALVLLVQESVGVTDAVSFLEALQLLVEERIGVVDEADLVRALQLLVQEAIAARDDLGLITPDAVFASLFTGASGTFTFENTGLTLTLAGVEGMGEAAVLRLADAGTLRRAGALDDRWLIVLDEALTVSPESSVRIELGEIPDGTDPAALDVFFRPTGAADFEALETTTDGAALVATGLSGSGALEVVARPVSRGVSVPEAFALHAPFPNPTRGGATVRFDLPAAAPVALAVYDVLGRRVAVLAEGDRPAGRHEARLPGGLAPGSYLVRIEAGLDVAVRRLVVLR